jgi:hypothetical protein
MHNLSSYSVLHIQIFHQGISLIASEDIDEREAVVMVPLKLTMCRQSARNVLIAGRGKYLGKNATT